jgi:trehalose 6-phosphate phosphatase
MMTESRRNSLPIPPPDLLSGASLFLDLDGTLVGIESRPTDVVVGSALKLLMERLATRLDRRVAIISGRPSEQVSAMFGKVAFAIAGNHGLEIRWPDGNTMSAPPPSNLDEVEVEMASLRMRHPNLVVERKSFSVALHYRLAPEARDECHALAAALGRRTGLQLQSGKMVFELKAPWADKGSALSFLMAGREMAGTRPIFVGDDETDEAAFEAAIRLGGTGVLVGPPRPTAACYGLPDVESTLRWLEAGVELLL